jgi:hypothetical protein
MRGAREDEHEVATERADQEQAPDASSPDSALLPHPRYSAASEICGTA